MIVTPAPSKIVLRRCWEYAHLFLTNIFPASLEETTTTRRAAEAHLRSGDESLQNATPSHTCSTAGCCRCHRGRTAAMYRSTVASLHRDRGSSYQPVDRKSTRLNSSHVKI